MNPRFFALPLLLAPAAVLANGDYLGTLKAPQSTLTPQGVYSFTTSATMAPNFAASSENGYRLKLGYKYSRYFAVEGEYVDLKRATDPFTNPASLASSFRSTGFGVDTIAMLPWRSFSLYGRMGAYRGDARGGFDYTSTALLPDTFTRGARWRYGMGVRYDFTRSLGIRAEVERHQAFGSGFAGDLDSADQVSVGVSWRF